VSRALVLTMEAGCALTWLGMVAVVVLVWRSASRRVIHGAGTLAFVGIALTTGAGLASLVW
jgi:hypothetical protein